MRKKIGLLFILLAMSLCARTPSAVEKIMEDGTEVVINPADLDRKEPLFSLEEEFVMDLEEERLASLGLTDIWGFDVDSEGSIYLFKPPWSDGDRILKFDQKGDFLFSFAPPGQGPGEIQRPSYQKMNSRDLLPVPDLGQSKVVIFNKGGKAVNEVRVEGLPGAMGSSVFQLENGNYLTRRTWVDPSSETLYLVLCLCGPDLKEIKEMDRFKIVQPIEADKVEFPMHISLCCASYDRIYVGNEDNGYEIQVYDLNGDIIRKIRKKYGSIKVDDMYKKEIGEKLKDSPDELKNKMYFPEYYPPFSYLFADDENNLYVKTFEKRDSFKDRRFDVFNSDGIFQGTVNMEAHVDDPFFTLGAPFDSWVMAKKKNRLYCLREKESGYKKLMVYRLD
jgi:hypothetical protein